MYKAIQAGYRLLDGAGDYGNEKEAGEGVKRALADGLVKREELCEFGYLFLYSFLSNSHSQVITSKVYQEFHLCI